MSNNPGLLQLLQSVEHRADPEPLQGNLEKNPVRSGTENELLKIRNFALLTKS